MAWQYLLAGITPAIKAGYLLANKPKPDDYRDKFGEEALNKLIANNQADIVNKTLLNQTTSAAKSLGSRLYQNTQHELDIAKEKGLLSSGQHAQALLSAGSDIQGKVGEQQQQALIQNTEFTAGLKANLDQQRLELGRIKDQAAKDYKAATKQWEAELFGVGMDFATVGANFAQAKFAEAGTQRFMDDLMKEYPDWSNLTYQQQNGILLKMQLHQLGYKFPTTGSIGTSGLGEMANPSLLPEGTVIPQGTQGKADLLMKAGLFDEAEQLLKSKERTPLMTTYENEGATLSPGASATQSETLIPGVQDPSLLPSTKASPGITADVPFSMDSEALIDAAAPPPAAPVLVKAQLNGGYTKTLNTGEYTVGNGDVSVNEKGYASVGQYRVLDANGNHIQVKTGDTLTLGPDGYWTKGGGVTPGAVATTQTPDNQTQIPAGGTAPRESATYGDSNAALGVKQGSYTVGKGKQFSRNTKTGELVVKVNGSYYKVRINGNTIKVKVGDTVTVGADGNVKINNKG